MADSGSEHREHVREAGETIEELRKERRQRIPAAERLVERVMARLGSPTVVLVAVCFIVVWIALDLALRPRHLAFDTDTFALLGLIAQLCSLVIVLTILSGQSSQRTMEEERDRLTLQLTHIIDKKISEAIEHRQTDLHEAAQVLREAERKAGPE